MIIAATTTTTSNFSYVAANDSVTMADIAGDVAVNPDAQAAVTDFLDYTEYLPADLIRSLTLIRGLDETYLNNSYAVHDLTKIYGKLPDLPPAVRPSAQQLRTDISKNLDRALNARESAYAEACRLFELTDRHENRLKSIIAKLHALPKPPSRDPTPPPQTSTSAKRGRDGRKLENGISTTRLTLKPPKRPSISLISRPKHRRVTVPGEVLPPYDPDEPLASTEVSDWESERAASPVRPMIKLKTPKVPKSSTEIVERKPRETATYRKPTPPPEDAELGSKHKPWTRLTDYEMYKLRKKMKKNHTWEPSDVMIRRELGEKGRGWENYYKAKADAQANGTKFLDLDIADKSQDTAVETIEPLKTTPVANVTPAIAATKGKPARKLEAKKEKEEPVTNKAALAAQEAELAARRLGDIGSAFKNLFSPFSNALASLNRSTSTPTNTASNVVPGNAGKKGATGKPSKKRKLDEVSISQSPSAEPENQKKKQKIAAPTPAIVSAPTLAPKLATGIASESSSAGTIKIPLKLNVTAQPASSSVASTPASPSKPVNNQRTSVVPKTEASSPVPSRPSSRRSPTAPAESTLTTTRASRRTSMTPAASGRKTPVVETTPKTTQTAASRRSKRDAPGTVTQSSLDGGAAVSISQRKSRPNKQKQTVAVPVQKPVANDIPLAQIRIDVDGNQEIVDPDEQRYCVCGDVSWGEMICCELDEKVSKFLLALDIFV